MMNNRAQKDFSQIEYVSISKIWFLWLHIFPFKKKIEKKKIRRKNGFVWKSESYPPPISSHRQCFRCELFFLATNWLEARAIEATTTTAATVTAKLVYEGFFCVKVHYSTSFQLFQFSIHYIFDPRLPENTVQDKIAL